MVDMLNSREVHFAAMMASCDKVSPETLAREAAHAMNLLLCNTEKVAELLMMTSPVMSVMAATAFLMTLEPVGGYEDPRCAYAYKVARQFRADHPDAYKRWEDYCMSDVFYAKAFAAYMVREHKTLVQTFSDVCEHIIEKYWRWEYKA